MSLGSLLAVVVRTIEPLPSCIGDRPALEEQTAVRTREGHGVSHVDATPLHDLSGASGAGGIVAAVLTHGHAGQSRADPTGGSDRG